MLSPAFNQQYLLTQSIHNFWNNVACTQTNARYNSNELIIKRLKHEQKTFNIKIGMVYVKGTIWVPE